ncbi:MAG TPA: MerR family transcriptional regulator [Steroidobacteraceae bacterium]|nr:MerR family transcriptional regulator [Steroidobacteraceae bacterium]
MAKAASGRRRAGMAAQRPAREMTIGALARRARVAPSMLRYYEQEGLLKPARRTAAGYRLYGPDAEKTLLFIHRAQRLGFSLQDIRHFLLAPAPGVARIAERRFVEIERRLTELMVLRHELEVFQKELSEQMSAPGSERRLYRRLIDRICGHSGGPSDQAASLRWLMNRLGCDLGSWNRREVLTVLQGRHLHLWREQDGYSVLVPDRDPRVGAALQQIAASEAGCSAHEQPTVEQSDEGYVFTARGENAFLFAQFFLALEHEPALRA